MSSKIKFAGTLLYLWFWDSAFGSPVLTRTFPLSMMETLMEQGVITEPSMERMVIAVLVTVIGLIVWKVKQNDKADSIGSPVIRNRVRDRKRYAQSSRDDHQEASHTDQFRQDKEVSYDHYGQGSITQPGAQASLGDGLNTRSKDTSFALFGAGAEAPANNKHPEHSPQPTSSHQPEDSGDVGDSE